MNNPKGYISVTLLQDLLSAIVAHNDELDEAERPPEGDDYNDICHMTIAKLSGLIAQAGAASPDAPGGAEFNTASLGSTESQTPSTSQVGKVLGAIISRISLADTRAILAAHERCWQEQLNGNAGSQNRVSNDFDTLTRQVADRMVTSDRQYVERMLAPPTPTQTT